MRSQLELGDRFQQAFALASDLHAGQPRKGSQIPYIGHLLGVAALVIEEGVRLATRKDKISTRFSDIGDFHDHMRVRRMNPDSRPGPIRNAYFEFPTRVAGGHAHRNRNIPGDGNLSPENSGSCREVQ